MKKLFAVLFIAVALLLSGIAFAADNCGQQACTQKGQKMLKQRQGKQVIRTRKSGRKMKSGRGYGAHFASKLNLTQDQQDKLARIREDHVRATQKDRAEIKRSMEAVQRMKQAERINYVAVENQLRKISDLRVKMQLEALKTRERSWKVLTKEQQATMKNFRAQKQTQWQEGKVKRIRKAPGSKCTGTCAPCTPCVKTKQK
jgi:Spy/CpxP family protein refolding chaperone